MITTVFGKTRPVNFIFLVAFLFLFFFGVHIFILNTEVNVWSLLRMAGIFVLILFSLFLSNFISKKNGLTKDNTYVVLLFVLALCFFPYTFDNTNIIISNVFVLLALRRIISLKTYYHVKIKIFDASLWLCIATIFYGWAILFFFLVYVAILHYGLGDLRNWLIPVIAVVLVGVFISSFYFLFDRWEELSQVLNFHIELKIEKYADLKHLIPFLYILGMGGLSSFSYFTNIKAKLSEQQSLILLVLVAFFISVFISLLSVDEDTSEFIFIAFPLAVMTANYIEIIEKKWFKEFLLWTFVAMPFVILWL
ncbi:DUF6427 family protein [Abyssalbus ytuae]|uniref:DUF6427 family protein n=1 Tax=Abyssalbus ytuae TaxID=2926907 RepID=A0A9E7D1L4_9FLAO|nr:DUF6427 family protein [Abyssalbus ytuae]UOB19435.1 DUF6427 family protein [Abyssalbus ytuae]